jgi:hypothetical protein
MSLSPRLKIPAWIATWALTRFYMLVQIGFWTPIGAEYQDANSYEAWSNILATQHTMPVEESWQYPPGAGFLMLIPRLGGGDFRPSFVAMMLIIDLIGLALIALLAKREHRDTGVWIWLLAMPLIGVLPILRFDLVPTVIAIAALIVIHRRPTWFGLLAGIGAMVKVWPAFVLFGEWDRKRLLRSVIAAAAAVAAVFAIAAILFGSQTGFLTNQGDRGLQIESVAATPWQLRYVINGTSVPTAQRFGTNEVDSDLGSAVGKALDVVALAVLLAAAVWWWMRDRAIRRGRRDLADEVLSRDFVFTVVLLFVVTSRVLSPQFMVWLVGLSAVVLTAGRSRLRRPAWILVAAVALTGVLSPENLVIRNLALLFATLDAAVIMARVVIDRPSPVPSSPVRVVEPAISDSQ